MKVKNNLKNSNCIKRLLGQYRSENLKVIKSISTFLLGGYLKLVGYIRYDYG